MGARRPGCAAPDAPSGLEQSFQSAVVGTTDFTNNELVLDVTSAVWADFQTAAETLAAQVTASDAALARVYTRHGRRRASSRRSAGAPTAGR